MSKEKSINLKAIKKAQYFHWIWTATEQMQFSRNHDPICVNIKRDAFLEIITSEIILFIFLISLEESENVLMFFYSSHSIRYTHKINLLCFNKHFVLWARRLRLVDRDILFDLYQLIQHPVLSVWKVLLMYSVLMMKALQHEKKTPSYSRIREKKWSRRYIQILII